MNRKFHQVNVFYRSFAGSTAHLYGNSSANQCFRKIVTWASIGSSGRLMLNGTEVHWWNTGSINAVNENRKIIKLFEKISVPFDCTMVNQTDEDQNHRNPYSKSSSRMYILFANSHWIYSDWMIEWYKRYMCINVQVVMCNTAYIVEWYVLVIGI